MLKKLPEISRITEFWYNNAVQIYGEGFGKDAKVYIWNPEGFNIDIRDTKEVELPQKPCKEAICFKPQKILNQVLYVYADKRIKTGVAIIWVENENGFSKPFVANCPRIFGTSHRKIACGEIYTVYGSLMNELRTKVALFENKVTGEKILVNNAYDPNYNYNREKYITEFIIPMDMPEGDYTVKINNQTAGNYGWSEPVDLTIDNNLTYLEVCRNRWNETAHKPSKNIEFKYIMVEAAKEGAYKDMTDVLQSAIDSMDEGVVLLSAGVYGISRTLNLKKGVILKGAGNQNTIIKVAENKTIKTDWDDMVFARRKKGMKRWANDWKPMYVKYNYAALIRVYAESGIEDVGFELGAGANVGVLLAPKDQEPIFGAFFNSIYVDGKYHSSFCEDKGSVQTSHAFLSVGSTEELVIYNSTFKSIGPIKLLPSRNIRTKLINNLFEGSPAQTGESFVGGAYLGMFIGNRFNSGRRSFMSQDGFYYNLVYQNRSSDVARSENAQEVYMSEFGESIWHGFGKEHSEISFAPLDDIDALCAPQNFNDRLSEYDQIVVIINGRGFGQYRKIIDFKDGKIILDKPWHVVPDDTTMFTVVQSTLNNVWLNNNSESSNGPTMFFYGSGVDNIVSGHILNMASHMRMWAGGIRPSETLLEREYQIQVGAYNLIDGCQSKASGKGIDIDSSYFRENRHFRIEEAQKVTPELKAFARTNGVFGNVVRNNAFDGSQSLFYCKNQRDWLDEKNDGAISFCGAYNIAENNRLQGYESAVSLVDDCEGNYIGNNLYSKESKVVVGFAKNAVGPDV